MNPTFTKHHVDTDVSTLNEINTDSHSLVVWNDDTNTFDWVIQTLIEICNHNAEQAEQCTLLIHFKGQCVVKTGCFSKLRPMCEAIIDRGINATVEELVS